MTENRVELMRALFPDLADRVDAAYAAFAGERPEAAFDDWVDARAAEVLPSAARLSIEDAAVAERFDRAFASAHFVAELLGVPAPEIEAFAEAGVDLEQLAAGLVSDPTLVPVAAPHGLGSAVWHEAFEAFGGPALLVADEAEREFEALDAASLTGVPFVALSDRIGQTAGGAGIGTQIVLPAQTKKQGSHVDDHILPFKGLDQTAPAGEIRPGHSHALRQMRRVRA